ncbi:MAG: hypothetical protein R3D89_05775 [Sphingomonadaceae bacterium]
MNINNFVIMFSISLVSISDARAWEANPTDNRYQQGRSLDLIPYHTLHEDITWSALECAATENLALDAQGLPQCPPLSFPARAPEPGNFDSALIRGVWWNDDPNQLLNSVHYGTWVIYMKDGKRRSRTQGRINSTYKMQYRSHYGDLQFLHAMASSDGQEASETQRKIMDWMEFAYAVSVGDIAAHARMGEIDYSMAKEYFSNQSGWSVNYLFRPKYLLRGNSLPDNALGSMLHVIQDSYAGGHAGRNPGPTEACPFGTIGQFRAYQSQDEKKHANADSKQALLETDPRLVPINARLIQLHRAKADWDAQVRPFLEQVFCISASSQPSGPGEFGNGKT